MHRRNNAHTVCTDDNDVDDDDDDDGDDAGVQSEVTGVRAGVQGAVGLGADRDDGGDDDDNDNDDDDDDAGVQSEVSGVRTGWRTRNSWTPAQIVVVVVVMIMMMMQAYRARSLEFGPVYKEQLGPVVLQQGVSPTVVVYFGTVNSCSYSLKHNQSSASVQSTKRVH